MTDCVDGKSRARWARLPALFGAAGVLAVAGLLVPGPVAAQTGPAPSCEPVRTKTSSLQRAVTASLNQLRSELARLEPIAGADQVRLRRQIRRDSEAVLRELQAYLGHLRAPATRACAADKAALDREIAHRTQSMDQIRAALARF